MMTLCWEGSWVPEGARAPVSGGHEGDRCGKNQRSWSAGTLGRRRDWRPALPKGPSRERTSHFCVVSEASAVLPPRSRVDLENEPSLNIASLSGAYLPGPNPGPAFTPHSVPFMYNDLLVESWCVTFCKHLIEHSLILIFKFLFLF